MTHQVKSKAFPKFEKILSNVYEPLLIKINYKKHWKIRKNPTTGYNCEATVRVGSTLNLRGIETNQKILKFLCLGNNLMITAKNEHSLKLWV